MGPLHGLKVIDLTSMVSGPVAGAMLADQGALVVKVEPTHGEQMRFLGPARNGVPPTFFSCNRGKESIAVDLKREAGQKVLWKLIEEADILLQNFRPGAMERMGFGETAVRARNEGIMDLIYPTQDGFITAGVISDKEWRGMCRALDREDLVEDERFKTAQARTRNARERKETTLKEIAKWSSGEILARLNAHDVPSAPLLRRTELLDNEQIVASESIERHQYEGFGEVRQARPAAQFGRTPSEVRGPAPRLGEHTRKVLSELGYSEAEVRVLVEDGVVVDA